MAIYRLDGREFRKIEPTTFAQAGVRERTDLQRLLKNQIEIIAPNTLVISEEFGEWEDSKRRIDLLALDKDANIVVIELKRTEDGGHMELQAVRYAAMVSTITFDQAVTIFAQYLAKNGVPDDARETILEFLGWDEQDDEAFGEDVRIILASAEFSRELTTAVMWLNEKGLDIRCVRLKPYREGDQLLVDVQQVIPLPEAAEYQVRIREKQQQERAARSSGKDLTKFDVTVGSKTFPRQTKRGMMFQIISALVRSGIHPAQVADVIPWRKNNLFVSFDGSEDEETFVEHLMQDDAGGAVPLYKRYFSSQNELLYVDGKTYALSNQWGLRTLEAVERLQHAFPSVSIQVKPTSELT
jgi:hypothetical protein